MKPILSIVGLALLLTGCIYAGPAPGYGYYSSGYSRGSYYGGAYGYSGYPGPPSSESVASPG
jgi:hypothetical protein